MRAGVWPPNNQDGSFAIAADWLTGDRVDKCQPPGGDEAHLASSLDCLPEPADGRISRNQHDCANMVLTLRCGFLHKRRDVAIWGIQPAIAGSGEVIPPRRFKRVLFSRDELAT